jgi:hypothetical protein
METIVTLESVSDVQVYKILSRGLRQEANAKHQPNLNLLFQTHLQFSQRPEWQTHNTEIESDINCRGEPPQQVKIDAFSLKRTIPCRPRSSHGKTLESKRNAYSDIVHDHDHDRDPHGDLEPLHREEKATEE